MKPISILIAEDQHLVRGALKALLELEEDFRVVGDAASAAEGRNTALIAERLCLSEGTVRNYLSVAIGKLGASNRIEAARIARQKGWLY